MAKKLNHRCRFEKISIEVAILHETFDVQSNLCTTATPGTRKKVVSVPRWSLFRGSKSKNTILIKNFPKETEGGVGTDVSLFYYYLIKKTLYS
jgi:hypothetical protein